MIIRHCAGCGGRNALRAVLHAMSAKLRGMDRIHAVNKVIPLSSLDMNLLVVFDALLKDRVVTHAARRVGMSQPAMSSALARLRKTFNDPLFVRTGAGMQPTPYAQLLAPPIQRACELAASSLEIETAFRTGWLLDAKYDGYRIMCRIASQAGRA